MDKALAMETRREEFRFSEPTKSKGGIAAANNSSIWEAETETPYPRASWLARLVGIGGLRFSKRLLSQLVKWKVIKVSFRPTRLHTHKCMHTHTYMHVYHT